MALLLAIIPVSDLVGLREKLIEQTGEYFMQLLSTVYFKNGNTIQEKRGMETETENSMYSMILEEKYS